MISQVIAFTRPYQLHGEGPSAELLLEGWFDPASLPLSCITWLLHTALATQTHRVPSVRSHRVLLSGRGWQRVPAAHWWSFAHGPFMCTGLVRRGRPGALWHAHFVRRFGADVTDVLDFLAGNGRSSYKSSLAGRSSLTGRRARWRVRARVHVLLAAPCWSWTVVTKGLRALTMTHAQKGTS